MMITLVVAVTCFFLVKKVDGKKWDNTRHAIIDVEYERENRVEKKWKRCS